MKKSDTKYKSNNYEQYFTKKDNWLTKEVKDFILNSGCSILYDPFAGGGDLLTLASERLNIKKIKGYDIDSSLKWEVNDSLLNIPHIDNAIIITNPPFRSKTEATNRKLDYSKYFSLTDYTDLYMIALDNMLKAQDYVVAIIPESFITSRYRDKGRLVSIITLTDSPFLDTTNPSCVVCFDNKEKPLSEVKVYKDEKYINTLQNILDTRILPTGEVPMKFNDINGWLGLRAIDSTNGTTRIGFTYKENIKYDWSKMGQNSRFITCISIDIPNRQDEFINRLNEEIERIRVESDDLILAPFKNNTKDGKRRRRLIFNFARGIIEKVYKEMYGERQLFLF